MATQNIDFCGILAETTKITTSHSRHFLALSVILLLPLSFSFIAFPTLQNSITLSSTTKADTLLQLRYNLHHQQPIGSKPIFFSLLFAFTLLVLCLCATATITYSVYHGFFNRPVKLVSAVKSLFNSLPRLFATLFCAQVTILASFVCVGLIVFAVIKGIEYLGFPIEYTSVSVCFRILWGTGLVALGLGALYFHLSWALAPVIVVVESSWGFEPLRRSGFLVKGMRGLVVYLLAFFGGLMWLVVWGSWESLAGSGMLRDLMFVVQTVLISFVFMLLLLHSLAANTVVYLYCKALHGELAGEIAEEYAAEFARECVSLLLDEAKDSHVVSSI